MALSEFGVATTPGNMVQAIIDFLDEGSNASINGGQGWTEDEAPTGARASIHKGSAYIHFKYADADPDGIAFYQSTGFSAATNPSSQPGDSGVCSTSTTPGTTERGLSDIGTGPFNYWLYTDANASYCWVVVEYSTGAFRTAGFGNITKKGDWTGGEFCCGTVHTSSNVFGTQTNFLMDASANPTLAPMSLRMSGLPNQTTSPWGVAVSKITAPGNDRAFNTRNRLMGASKVGFHQNAYSWLRNSASSGLTPLIPQQVVYIDSSADPDRAYILGELPNIRYVNLANYAEREIITVGSDDWQLFPWSIKTSSAVTGRSYNSGWAIKRI